MTWTQRFAARTQQLRRSPVREILKLAQQPGMISFGGGLPATELLPVAEVRAAADAVMARSGAQALQYGQSEGIPELRDWVAKQVSRGSLRVERENVLIVSGAQQGLDLLGRVLLEAKDKVLVENPTYLALLSAWAPCGVDFVPVPSDDAGMKVDVVQQLIARQPKLIYAVPNFQNPQGTTLSGERRRQLVEILHESGVCLVEDDPYAELRYDGPRLPSLLEIDAQLRGRHRSSSDDFESNVVAVGSFSKVLAPGLRVGWVIGPTELIDKLVLVKQAADLQTSSLCQLVALELIRQGTLATLGPKLRQAYQIRRDTMLEALKRYLPDDVRWTRPEGGMFLLVTLPRQFDAGELLSLALDYQVAFVPGESFHLNGEGRNTFRLNFSHTAPSQIEEGIQRLGQAMERLRQGLSTEVIA